MGTLLFDQGLSGQSTVQGSVNLGSNVPAFIRGWEKDGGARIELLAEAEGHAIGTEFAVSIRPDARGRVIHDFASLNKAGLRVGGIVLLRRFRASEPGIGSAKSAETLIMRESDGAPFVFQNAAACILPPRPGTAVVDRCLIAVLSAAVEAHSLSEGMAKLSGALDQPAVFGHLGLAYFGRTRAGDPVEIIIGGDEEISGSDIISKLFHETPKDIMKEARTSGTSRRPWMIVPFFQAVIDPDRASKLSAQAVNHSYGNLNEPRWSKGHAVLRAIGDQWHVCDATPAEEPSTALPFYDLKII